MRAKKSLGQNFLISEKIARDIVRAANVTRDDIILEVGPGKGILTEELAKKAGKVIAVEKDRRLAEFLREKFSGFKNLDVVCADILKFNPDDYGLKKNGYKIVANIPYYITSRFLREFLGGRLQPSKMVLMIQKEVAERIVARDKKASILSVSVRAFGDPKILRTVPANYFSPKPKVNSAILIIDNISKLFFESSPPIEENVFFEILRKGFSGKRKMLKNNLPEFTEEDLVKCKISPKARAENLSLENWRCLTSLGACLKLKSKIGPK